MQQFFSISLVCCLLATSMASAIWCDTYCAIPQEKVNEPIQLMRFRCGCMNGETHRKVPGDPGKASSTAKPASTSTKSRQGETLFSSEDTLCDYLCSIQQGGDACNCGNASLPGK